MGASDGEGAAQAGSEPMIRGAMVLNNIRAFGELVGAATVEAAVARLPEAARAEYRAIVAAAWVPSSSVDVIFSAIAAEAGRDLRELFPKAIERGVEKTLTTVWRALLRFTSDKALIKRTPQIFNRSYSRGRLASSFPRPGIAHVQLTDWPHPAEYRLLAIAAGIRTVLRLAGRKNVAVSFERAEGGAEFEATWDR